MRLTVYSFAVMVIAAAASSAHAQVISTSVTQQPLVPTQTIQLPAPLIMQAIKGPNTSVDKLMQEQVKQMDAPHSLETAAVPGELSPSAGAEEEVDPSIAYANKMLSDKGLQ